MTKAELIKELELYPDDIIVCGDDNEFGEYEITQVVQEKSIFSDDTNIKNKIVLVLR